jgi:hypothetical protein
MSSSYIEARSFKLLKPTVAVGAQVGQKWERTTNSFKGLVNDTFYPVPIEDNLIISIIISWR